MIDGFLSIHIPPQYPSYIKSSLRCLEAVFIMPYTPRYESEWFVFFHNEYSGTGGSQYPDNRRAPGSQLFPEERKELDSTTPAAGSSEIVLPFASLLLLSVMKDAIAVSYTRRLHCFMITTCAQCANLRKQTKFYKSSLLCRQTGIRGRNHLKLHVIWCASHFSRSIIFLFILFSFDTYKLFYYSKD